MDLNEILFHHGEPHDEWYNSIAPPIYQTSNFKINSVNDFKEKIKDEFSNYLYTRGNNPTVHILRKKLAELEATEDALVLSSGSAAISAAILSVVASGDHIISVKNPYTWTRKFIDQWLSRFGIEHTYVDGTNPENFETAIKTNTKLIILESPNSLTFELQDLEKVSKIATKYGIKTLIDNSYCTPLYQKPHEFGIDLIIHSATKYLNGHSDVVAGVICGSEVDIRKIFYNEYMMLGAICSPLEASMILRGIRTLNLRVERSTQSALHIAQELENHPAVRKVIHPHLDSFDQVVLARKQMKACGGLFSIILNTDEPELCALFSDSLKQFSMAASWGGYESLQMPMVAFSAYAGTASDKPPFNLVRLYIGLEEPEFLLKDLYQALEKINH
jgi:cystathionine beta-lyase/cystathionine gamma-synthase